MFRQTRFWHVVVGCCTRKTHNRCSCRTTWKTRRDGLHELQTNTVSSKPLRPLTLIGLFSRQCDRFLGVWESCHRHGHRGPVPQPHWVSFGIYEHHSRKRCGCYRRSCRGHDQVQDQSGQHWHHHPEFSERRQRAAAGTVSEVRYVEHYLATSSWYVPCEEGSIDAGMAAARTAPSTKTQTFTHIFRCVREVLPQAR